MGTSANLISSEVHEVQEAWTSQKDLRTILCTVKTSPKDICFFRVVPPTKLPKIMGLRESIPLRLCDSRVGFPSVCDVEKKGRMKVQL